jgi:hypothetical protein
MLKKNRAIKRLANNMIGWNSKFGLHISDGVDSCSGEDYEEQEKARKYLIKRIQRLLNE